MLRVNKCVCVCVCVCEWYVFGRERERERERERARERFANTTNIRTRNNSDALKKELYGFEANRMTEVR